MSKDTDKRTEDETAKEFDKAVKAMLNTPPEAKARKEQEKHAK